MQQNKDSVDFIFFTFINRVNFGPIMGTISSVLGFYRCPWSALIHYIGFKYHIKASLNVLSQKNVTEQRFSRFSIFHLYNSSEFGPIMGQFEVF